VGRSNSINGDIIGNHGGDDALVVKISASGALEWQKALGGTFDERAFSIICIPEGGYIVVGDTSSYDGDVTGNHGNGDAWVIKLSLTGDIIWQKTFGGNGSDSLISIQSTPDGGYIAAGWTNSTDGDVTGFQGGYTDSWVVKMSAAGVIEWQKTLGGSGEDWIYSIQSTLDDGYLVIGTTSSFDGDITNYYGGCSDAWAVKLDATGAIVWQKTMGGTGEDAANGAQLTSDGSCIFAGYTSSTDGDVTGNHLSMDAWVVKISSTGDLIWQKSLGGIGYDQTYGILLTPDGGCIVAGYSSSTDGDLTSNHGNIDLWVVKLSLTGDIIWQKTIGGTSDDRAYNIQSTTDGGFITTGYSKSNNGDVTGNHGGSDVWVVKLGTDLSTTGFEKSTVVVYPNPASTLLTVQNNCNTSIDSITITDIMGKVVFTQKSSNTNSINVASLACGTYLLEATSGKDQFTSKFVKE